MKLHFEHDGMFDLYVVNVHHTESDWLSGRSDTFGFCRTYQGAKICREQALAVFPEAFKVTIHPYNFSDAQDPET